MFYVGLFVSAFIFELYVFLLKTLLFYYQYIESAESGTDSPHSGCEAATQCTKTYTVIFIQIIKVYFLIE